MLEERPGFRRRVGSARLGASRVGSARQLGSRGGLARQANGRIGSARPSSDSRRPKLHTGRPASAPPGHVAAHTHTARPTPTCTPGFVKVKDVGHLNLKVEGKSVSCHFIVSLQIYCYFFGCQIYDVRKVIIA